MRRGKWERRLVQAVLCSAFFVSSCFPQRVKQQEQLAAMCRISGTLSAPQESANPLVVVLVRYDDARHEIVDQYAVERPGRWTFIVTPGTYSLGAFSDRNDDLRYNPGESVVFPAQHFELGREPASTPST